MLLAGCYERFLFGYSATADSQAGSDDEEQSVQLKRAFTHAAHKGVVKCAAAAGQYAVTGGADDLIHLYDLKNDKDLGFLMSPGEGAVTALTFFVPAGAYNPTHLLSGSADGMMSVWQAGGGWEQMKTMRGHRKEVSGISVHPSGLIALSVSRDCCLRMWDLVKGRCTYTVKLEAEAESVAFCQEDGGARYALLCGTLLTLHSVQGDTGVLRTLAHPRRALCMAWAPGNRIVTGSEDGSLRMWDAETGDELLCINRAHASRIRTLALLPTGTVGGRQDLLVATGSSDGSLKLWDLRKAAAAAPGSSGGACLAEAQTRARLTCMAAADPPALMQQRLQAATAVRQAAAKKRQKQQKQQQGSSSGGDKKRRHDGKAAAAEEQQRPAKKQQQQQQQRTGGSSGGKGHGSAKQAGKAGGKAGSEQAAPAADVVERDGVVEFLDSPEQAKKQKKKQLEVQKKSQRAAHVGKPFRSVPGQKRQAGGKTRGPKPRL